MPVPTVSFLTTSQIEAIHEASLAILDDTGVMVHHPEVLELLGQAGARLEATRPIAHVPESLVTEALARVGRKYVLHGRDPKRVARFGYGELVQLSSPGQYRWLDLETERLRPATLQDARDAIRLGDALPNITFVGAIAQPAEISEKYREVVLTAELVKGTAKPTMAWTQRRQDCTVCSGDLSRGGGRRKGVAGTPDDRGLPGADQPAATARRWTGYGAGICGRRPTGFRRTDDPCLWNRACNAGGDLGPGECGDSSRYRRDPVAWAGHTDEIRRDSAHPGSAHEHLLFGSPEQALMAVAMVQMGKFYGLPVYINVGLTDAKLLDAQAGTEKAATLVLGALAGADMFGHAGICGTDHAGSLAWLMADNEIMAYVKRITRGSSRSIQRPWPPT